VVGRQGSDAKDGWKGMRSRDIIDKETEDDVSMWGSMNRAEIVHKRRNK
jgi:hypothetical protein